MTSIGRPVLIDTQSSTQIYYANGGDWIYFRWDGNNVTADISYLDLTTTYPYTTNTITITSDVQPIVNNNILYTASASTNKITAYTLYSPNNRGISVGTATAVYTWTPSPPTDTISGFVAGGNYVYFTTTSGEVWRQTASTSSTLTFYQISWPGTGTPYLFAASGNYFYTVSPGTGTSPDTVYAFLNSTSPTVTWNSVGTLPNSFRIDFIYGIYNPNSTIESVAVVQRSSTGVNQQLYRWSINPTTGNYAWNQMPNTVDSSVQWTYQTARRGVYGQSSSHTVMWWESNNAFVSINNESLTKGTNTIFGAPTYLFPVVVGNQSPPNIYAIEDNT